ncbi:MULTISPECIES: hypothetical protein [unclassified Helicobacter]|nr:MULTISPECIES: hypothetical protein [unclassified Helicobacter]
MLDFISTTETYDDLVEIEFDGTITIDTTKISVDDFKEELKEFLAQYEG